MKPALRFLIRHAMHFAFVAMVVYFTMRTTDARIGFPGRFGTMENILNILNQNFPYFILGAGMTLVIISGGIDLSAGSVVAMCGVVATSVMMTGGLIVSSGNMGEPDTFLRLIPDSWVVRVGGPVAAGLVAGAFYALLAGAGVGAFNGWMVTKFRIPPFITTLAWFMTARGLALKFCKANPISNLPEAYTWLGQGQVGPTLFTVYQNANDKEGRPQSLWFPILVAAVITATIHLVLTRTRFGRHVFAVGGNEEAARLSGIRVRRNKMAVYTLNGLLAGICGILLAARLQSGDPKVGQSPPLELGAITAVVLGGASLSGGKGSIVGTLFGAVFMGVLDNGLTLLNMHYFDQLLVKGVVLIAAVLFDQLKERV